MCMSLELHSDSSKYSRLKQNQSDLRMYKSLNVGMGETKRDLWKRVRLLRRDQLGTDACFRTDSVSTEQSKHAHIEVF